MIEINIEKTNHWEVEAGQVRTNKYDQIVLVINDKSTSGDFNLICLKGFKKEFSLRYIKGECADDISKEYPTLLKAELNISDI